MTARRSPLSLVQHAVLEAAVHLVSAGYQPVARVVFLEGTRNVVRVHRHPNGPDGDLTLTVEESE